MISLFGVKYFSSIKGLSKSRLAVIGTVSLLILTGLIICAGLFSRPWPVIVIVSVISVLWVGYQVLWLKTIIAGYVQKLAKSTMTARRFQNISKYFESILQDSTDIIFSVDTEGYILKFNDGSVLHFGYTQEEIVGKPLRQLFVNEVDERKVVHAVLLKGKSVNEEIPMKTKDGRIILVNVSMSEMKGDSNQIIGLVVTAKDITEKKKLELELVSKNELLSRLAITDSLTELQNSRSFFDQIKRELSRFNRNPGHKLAMIMLDIDHFKELNDTEGHQMGDKVLRSLGEVIRVCIRKDIDMGFRYGGDEFIVLLPDTDKNQARFAADRITKQFSAFKFGHTSLSIGITEAISNEDEKSLLKRADEALYQSKREGRARITVL
jgi:diguanylate cyclase (GGDEF)-like protein/PAS domain S-box-containing protein